MPDIFDIDYSQQGPELLPPDKRQPNILKLMISLLFGLQWCRDFLFGSYKTGSKVNEYSTGSYNLNDQVIYQKSVYYSLKDNNTYLPSVKDSWLLIQSSFLGVDGRMKFNGQVVVLEYALNSQFKGIFRPPGSSSLSDIYLQNIPAVISGFLVATTGNFSSKVGATTSDDKIGLRYPFIQIFNFQINIRSDLYALTNESAIRDFVNLYIPKSLNFTIVQY